MNFSKKDYKHYKKQKKIVSKNQLTKYLKIFALLFGVSVFLWNCEKDTIDETPQIEKKKNLFTTRIIKLTEIPEIREFLKTKTTDDIFTKSTIINGAIFDEDNIMEVIDTLSNINYSFRFVYPETPQGTFYNLIVGKTPEGNPLTPYVLKYTCSENQLDTYIANNYDFKFFKGKVALHKYTDFFIKGSILKSDSYCPPEYDENGDPIPCEVDEVDTGNDSSGGGTSGNTGDSTSGSDNSGTTGGSATRTYISLTCTCMGHTASQIADGTCKCKTFVITFIGGSTKSFSTKSDSDCPDCQKNIDGGVGVNNPESKLATNKRLSNKSPYHVDMSSILDSIQLPVTENTEVANKKLLCAYNKLTNSSTFKNLFIDTFGDSDKFNVKFEVDDNLLDTIGGETGGTATFTNGNFTGINLTIKINKSKLLSNSNFNVVKTILHESIHAYLKLKLRDCNAGTTLDFINNLELGETINEFYDHFNCGAPKQSQHEFMFDYLLPTFQKVFTEIGNTNLTSQRSINYVNNNPFLIDNKSIDWNWQDFYRYFSMSGLHKTEAFKNEIENDSFQNDLYKAYNDGSKGFSKQCN